VLARRSDHTFNGSIVKTIVDQNFDLKAFKEALIKVLEVCGANASEIATASGVDATIDR
jgi:hypothetical protein